MFSDVRTARSILVQRLAWWGRWSLVAGVTVIGACGGGSDDDATEYVYVANSADDTVSQFGVSGNGTLSSLSTATVTVGDLPVGMVLHPSKNFVYVANNGSNTISQFLVGSDGKLSALSSASVATSAAPFKLAASPDGRYIFAGLQGAAKVATYAVGSSGGLTLVAEVSTSCTNVQGLAVDPNSSYVYAVGASNSRVCGFSIGSGGVLTAVSAVSSGGTSPADVVVDKSGNYLFVSNNDVSTSTIAVFAIDSAGGLSLQNTYSTVSNPVSLTLNSQGTRLYVGSGSSVGMHTVTTSGVLSSVSATAAGVTPQQVVIDASGAYAYAINRGSNSVSQYTVSTNGSLSSNSYGSAVSSGVGQQPYAIVTR
jgi:6-phosphogluconolactonase (cycloisomerase 2 family)